MPKFKCKVCGHEYMDMMHNLITSTQRIESFKFVGDLVDVEEFADDPVYSGGSFTNYECSYCGENYSEEEIIEMNKG